MNDFPIVFEVEVDSAIVSFEVETPEVEVAVNEENVVVFAVSPGGKDGAQGPPGATFSGVAWFYGDGAPDSSLTDAKPGDLYFDASTGNIYTLGE